MRKRLLSRLLALCMVVSLLPVTVWAEPTDATAAKIREDAENIIWGAEHPVEIAYSTYGGIDGSYCTASGRVRLDLTSVVIGFPDESWSGVTETPTSFNIPAQVDGLSVTDLGAVDIFYEASNIFNFTKVETVSVPEGVKYLHGSFAVVPNLKAVVLPASLIYIGGNSFTSCTVLASINFPNNLAYIAEDAFSGCASLQSIAFPESLLYIGPRAFSDCKALQTVTIPKNVGQIESGAFTGCPNLTIRCYTNSCAHQYALANSINYELLDYVPEEAPKIVNLSPENNERLTFDEKTPPEFSVTFDRNISSHTVVESIAIWREISGALDDKPVELKSKPTAEQNGRVLTIKLSTTLDPGRYYITLPAGAVTFEDNMTSPAIEKEKNSWHFSIGGLLVKEGEFSFAGAAVKNGKYTYSYDENWFLKDSAEYQHNLVKMSIRGAMAAYGVLDGLGGSNATNIKALMEGLHFSNIIDDYPKPETDSIGYIIGSKTILPGKDDPDFEEFSLIMVAVRGGNYLSEWAGNFRVGTGTTHEGFQRAAKKVLDGIQSYINDSKNNLSSQKKIWIMGFSRGAATTNLVAKALDDNQILGIQAKDVYAYCFECPQNTTDIRATNPKYNNIVNIINPIDIVTKVAMSGWGYKRYGKSYYLPYKAGIKTAEANYAALEKNMREKYKDLLNYGENKGGGLLYTCIPKEGQLIKVTDSIADNLAKLFENTGVYTQRHQTHMMTMTAKLLGHSQLNEDDEQGFLTALGNYTVEVGGTIGILLPHSIATFKGELLKAHYPELCLAWLDSLSGNASQIIVESPTPRYRTIFINCPVDIEICDSSSVLVGEIKSDVVTEIEDGVEVWIDENDQMVILLPCNEQYTINLTATDDGEVTYTATEYAMETGSTEKVVSYYQVDVQKGDCLIGTVEDLSTVDSAQYSLRRVGEDTPITPSIQQTGDDVQEYTVTVFVSGNGSTEGGGSYLNGEFAKVTAEADSGWVFQGWYVGDTLISPDTDYRFLVKADVNITAVFTTQSVIPGVFTVTFNANNGIVSPATMTTGKDGKLSNLPTPTRNGYIFDGWYTAEAGGTKVSTGTTFTKDTTVYAHWTANTPTPKIYTVTVTASPAEGGIVTGGGSYDEGVSATVKATANNGYRFIGWTENGITVNTSATYTFKAEANRTLTAVFEWIDNGDGGGGSTPSNPSYQITVLSTSNGTMTVTPTSAKSGDKVTIAATPNSGYKVDSVVVKDSSGNSVSVTDNGNGIYTFTMPDGSVTVSATFISIGGNGGGGGGSTSSNPSYQITVSTNSNGAVTVTPAPAKSGAKVTITATPNDGYTTDSVTVTDSSGKIISVTNNGDGTYTFKMPSSKVTVTATFAAIETPWVNPFTDVSESDWFYNEVAYVVQNGLMIGVGKQHFNPSGTTSRGMIVTILYRLEGEPTVSQSAFTDVEAGQYYTGAVAWAAANKIVVGYGNNTFGPNDDITREQMATILYRYADYKGYDVSGLADLSSYTDPEKISNWALTAMRWANRKGLITGRTTTTLVPKGTATRAETATILARFCRDIAGLE